MVKSIPPKTILDMVRVCREEKRTPPVKYSFWNPTDTSQTKTGKWVYETKPVFKKVRKPLVDVFKEAEEVKIIIDLGGFRRGEIDIDILPDRYVITAKNENELFMEEIVLPKNVDFENTEEHFKNGILEIVLPRKKSTG